MFDRSAVSLAGRKGLITGIANDQSIAWGCAKAFRFLGADLAVTYLSERAKPHVEPLARELEAEILLPLDLREDGQLEAVFAQIRERWGRSTSCCTRSPSRRARICMAGWSTAPRPASYRRWTSRAGRSSAWPSWRSR